MSTREEDDLRWELARERYRSYQADRIWSAIVMALVLIMYFMH